MPKVISIGKQNFASLRENDCFYIDKTAFIREWWESKDEITLITRPHRFVRAMVSSANHQSGNNSNVYNYV